MRELDEVELFNARGLWTQAMHQILVQGLKSSPNKENATPVHSEISYQISSVLSDLLIFGMDDPFIWEQLEQKIGLAKLVAQRAVDQKQSQGSSSKVSPSTEGDVSQ